MERKGTTKNSNSYRSNHATNPLGICQKLFYFTAERLFSSRFKPTQNNKTAFVSAGDQQQPATHTVVVKDARSKETAKNMNGSASSSTWDISIEKIDTVTSAAAGSTTTWDISSRKTNNSIDDRSQKTESSTKPIVPKPKLGEALNIDQKSGEFIRSKKEAFLRSRKDSMQPTS